VVPGFTRHHAANALREGSTICASREAIVRLARAALAGQIDERGDRTATQPPDPAACRKPVNTVETNGMT